MRNANIFETIINGGVVAHVAKEAGIVPESVRRIFLRECLKRAPDAYAEGVNVCNGRDPSIAWIKANAERFKSERAQIGQAEVETQQAIRMLEARGFAVTGNRPFTLATPLVALAVLTPRQKEYFARIGIKTLADAVKLDPEQLEQASDSQRQFDIIRKLIDLAGC